MNKIIKPAVTGVIASLFSFTAVAHATDSSLTTTLGSDLPGYSYKFKATDSLGSTTDFGAMTAWTSPHDKIGTDGMTLHSGKMKFHSGKMKMQGFGLTDVGVNPHLFNQALAGSKKWYPKRGW